MCSDCLASIRDQASIGNLEVICLVWRAGVKLINLWVNHTKGLTLVTSCWILGHPARTARLTPRNALNRPKSLFAHKFTRWRPASHAEVVMTKRSMSILMQVQTTIKAAWGSLVVRKAATSFRGVWISSFPSFWYAAILLANPHTAAHTFTAAAPS